jgi:hypothetical protein
MGLDKIGRCARLKMHANIASSLVIPTEWKVGKETLLEQAPAPWQEPDGGNGKW